MAYGNPYLGMAGYGLGMMSPQMPGYGQTQQLLRWRQQALPQQRNLPGQSQRRSLAASGVAASGCASRLNGRWRGCDPATVNRGLPPSREALHGH